MHTLLFKRGYPLVYKVVLCLAFKIFETRDVAFVSLTVYDPWLEGLSMINILVGTCRAQIPCSGGGKGKWRGTEGRTRRGSRGGERSEVDGVSVLAGVGGRGGYRSWRLSLSFPMLHDVEGDVSFVLCVRILFIFLCWKVTFVNEITPVFVTDLCAAAPVPYPLVAMIEYTPPPSP